MLKRVLKIIGIIMLVIIVLMVVLFVIAALKPAVPEDYTDTVKQAVVLKRNILKTVNTLLHILKSRLMKILKNMKCTIRMIFQPKTGNTL